MSINDLQKALGPLSSIFDDPEVTGVMVDGPNRISIEKQGTIEDVNARFESNEEVKEAIRAVLKAVDVEIRDEKTIYEVRLTDNSHMLAILSPTAINGHSMYFRKWLTKQITWDKLIEYNAVTPQFRQMIQSALDAHVSILVAGGTASGKTTLTNRILELIPPNERIVAVEQTHDLQFDHPRAVFLEAGGPAGVAFHDLILAGSKMRPDWLAIGELNGMEALRAMQIIGNGHSAITTIHAGNTEDALTRIETLCLMANLGLGLDEIRQVIASALRLIVYQECLEPNSKRRVTQVTELLGMENGRYILQPLLRYNHEAETLESTGIKPGWER